MRVRHDLMGCANRLHQSGSDFLEFVAEAKEYWRDQRGARFEREDLSHVEPAIDRLVVALREACEEINRFDRQLTDGEAN